MKKHLIAAAVAAAFAVPAMAQVTVSGLLDSGFYSIKSTQASDETSLTTNQVGTNERGTSTVNFTATEDLGGGLKAGFRMEGNIGATIGSSATTDAGGGFTIAQSFVELSGGFGGIKIGRVNTPTLSAEGARSPFGTNGKGGGYGSTSGIAPTRNTALEYTSPSFSGFTARIHHVPKGQNTVANRSAGNAAVRAITEIGLFYSAGPLALAVANHSQKDVENQTTLSGSYDLGVARVFAGYHTRDSDAAAPTANLTHGTIFSTAAQQTGAKSDGYNVGLTVPLGALSLHANVAQVSVKDRDQGDGSAVGLGADYAMSKRTIAYFRYGKVDSKNEDGVKNKGTLTGVGIQHSF